MLHRTLRRDVWRGARLADNLGLVTVLGDGA